MVTKKKTIKWINIIVEEIDLCLKIISLMSLKFVNFTFQVNYLEL